MSATMAEVKLLGFWSSPFSKRVEWALRLKGVEFEYVEEDLPNKKSDMLLQLNPVHKQVPVLVHNGRALSESLVILEYIDETWPDPPLLPADPYDRATARFWIQFLVDESPKLRAWMTAAGEQQPSAAAGARRMLATIEEKALGDREFFGGESINMVDIVYGFIAYWIPAAEKLQGPETLLDPAALPRLTAWSSRFRRSPAVGENLPEFDELVAYLGSVREKILLRR
ncbi:PREDICTED: probable glutathione S-transferase [Tarenaya hassleriana]|uniref:probable glutathione S-transferase n=1 Tax=Tarenaya hassleriana TaxID=28532 RepID=UPI00053C8D4A|nr:PREDICTED: probable glutathione S-transferase [Tarenaya hassleriana]